MLCLVLGDSICTKNINNRIKDGISWHNCVTFEVNNYLNFTNFRENDYRTKYKICKLFYAATIIKTLVL